MIDKKIESRIKILNGFIELWVKFHAIYDSSTSKELITENDEGKFLETKNILKNKYDELKIVLETRYSPHGRFTDPVSDILALDGIRFVSEKNLQKLKDDWRDSYIFLNSILEHLKDEKRVLERLNAVSVFFKKIFD